MSMNYTLTAERPNEDVVCFTYIDSQDGDLYICGSTCGEPLIVGQHLQVCDQTKQKSSGHSLKRYEAEDVEFFRTKCC